MAYNLILLILKFKRYFSFFNLSYLESFLLKLNFQKEFHQKLGLLYFLLSNFDSKVEAVLSLNSFPKALLEKFDALILELQISLGSNFKAEQYFDLRLSHTGASTKSIEYICDFFYYCGATKKRDLIFDRYLELKSFSEEAFYCGNFYLRSIGHLGILLERLLVFPRTAKTLFLSKTQVESESVANKLLLEIIIREFERNGGSVEWTTIDIVEFHSINIGHVVRANGLDLDWYKWRGEFWRRSQFREISLDDYKDYLSFPFRFNESFGIDLSKTKFISLHLRSRKDGSVRNDNNFPLKQLCDLCKNSDIWVVRFGASINRTEVNHAEKYINLSTEYWDNDGSIFLMATSLLCLNSSSGPSVIPKFFGQPCIQFNIFPIGHGEFSSSSGIFFKRVWSQRLSRFLPLEEICDHGLDYTEFAIWGNRDLEIFDCDYDELLDTVIKLLRGSNPEKEDPPVPLVESGYRF